jgi:cyclopropane-fatty-acyl-phospholipid synthase
MLGGLRGGCLLIREGTRIIRCGRQPGPCAEIEVRAPHFWSRLLVGGSLAAGETWVEGLWHSPDLVAVVRLLARNLPTLDRLERRLGWLAFPMRRLEHLLRPNSPAGSRTNIAAHYDMGNKMFAAFLDSRLQYSCALFPTPEASLEQAQRHKLDVVCRRLDLQPGEHLLEIGTGWGGWPCTRPGNTGAE